MNRVLVRAEEIPPPAWIKTAGNFIEKVLEALGETGREVSVLFCDNRYIKSLNARYRNKDEPTDVLSFPAGEPVPGAKGFKPAGDIVVSLDALAENARFFKVSADEELRRLLVHGMLHLSGYDHTTNNAGEPMLKMQEEILARLKDETIISPDSRGRVTEKGQ